MSEEFEIRPAGSEVEEGDTAVLLRYLKTHDVACPLCKYNLRGLVVPRCPECGRELRLTVGLTEPHLRGLVACLVPMCLSAGCGMLSLVVMASEFVRFGRWIEFDREYAIAFLFYGSAVSIVPTVILVIFHKRFIRRDTGSQRVLAALAWMWAGLLFVVLTGKVFRAF